MCDAMGTFVMSHAELSTAHVGSLKATRKVQRRGQQNMETEGCHLLRLIVVWKVRRKEKFVYFPGFQTLSSFQTTLYLELRMKIFLSGIFFLLLRYVRKMLLVIQALEHEQLTWIL